MLPTLRGHPEKVGEKNVPKWMAVKDVESGDKSGAAWLQRVKNALFGGMQADIFVVRGEPSEAWGRGISYNDQLHTSRAVGGLISLRLIYSWHQAGHFKVPGC